MGAPSPISTVSIEEYLCNPAYEHFEYIDGDVVELNAGNKPHSKIKSKCARKIEEYLDKRPGSYAAVELRCRVSVAGRTRFYLPDVAIVLADDASESRFLERAPDLFVEIRSPDDPIASLTRKMNDYFVNGAKVAWLVLPEERSALIFTPNAPPRTVLAGETLDGGDLLPDLQIALDELFA